ncbi:MAG: hypothetical protein H6Q33_1971 [Deltaproteobacteria bacterium]|nr:hypothetical protein [Deltaproteobacteria bacterium]
MADVVHVSYAGGGIFLPDEGPADRQYLVDYVAHLLHAKPKVQILRREQRWMAERCKTYCCCASCGRAYKAVCRETANDADPYCLRCALENEGRPSAKVGGTNLLRTLALSAAGG